MGMMGTPGSPFGGPYPGQANQGLGSAGLGPQLQNKGPMANNLVQFNVDKKNQPMQAMSSMVGTKYPQSDCKNELCNIKTCQFDVTPF